ncbi:MAG TPA: hypothetical protein PLJ29_16120 [Leptospiraceae bacterium]|nr:hypothetical protein [Leptospiraceae bacterium]HNI27888.1 hypothetical protein [Leptospiraceae bacterium]
MENSFVFFVPFVVCILDGIVSVQKVFSRSGRTALLAAEENKAKDWTLMERLHDDMQRILNHSLNCSRNNIKPYDIENLKTHNFH